METAISVSGSGAGVDEEAFAAADGEATRLGGAILTLLRSRWPSLEIRADWSEE